MTTIASPSTISATAVAPTEEMATSVLMVESIVKQLQLLKEKQGQIESQQRQIEALLKENVAEVVEQPVEIREYRRPLYKCPNCGWSGYSSLPLGVKEGFSVTSQKARGHSPQKLRPKREIFCRRESPGFPLLFGQ